MAPTRRTSVLVRQSPFSSEMAGTDCSAYSIPRPHSEGARADRSPSTTEDDKQVVVVEPVEKILRRDILDPSHITRGSVDAIRSRSRLIQILSLGVRCKRSSNTGPGE